MVLSDLKVNDGGIVKDIKIEGKTKKRLNELGINKGVKVIVKRIGILKSPIEIQIMNFNLAIRKELASKIEIEYE
jgi:Fe2+ transport system protein FeoA